MNQVAQGFDESHLGNLRRQRFQSPHTACILVAG